MHKYSKNFYKQLVALFCMSVYVGLAQNPTFTCTDYLNSYQPNNISILLPAENGQVNYSTSYLAVSFNNAPPVVNSFVTVKRHVFFSKEVINTTTGLVGPDWLNTLSPNVYNITGPFPKNIGMPTTTLMIENLISSYITIAPQIPEAYYVKVGVEGFSATGQSLGMIWSMPVRFVLLPDAVGLPGAVYLSNNALHSNDINWVYGVSYLDNGQTTEGIAYIDGLGKSRQVQSKQNSTNTIMAVEAVYSEEGGGSVMSLPAPIQNATAGQFKYDYQFFDVLDPVTNQARDFDTKDFDREVKGQPGTANALMSPVAVSGSSSLGKFYSSQNTDSYIDDAKGYPYVYGVGYNNPLQRALYTLGGAGDALKMTSGKEYKHYYGRPDSQQELDRVYGNSSNKKADKIARSVTFDPEGVGHVSYTDNEGKLIATAIMGCNTPNLGSVQEEGMSNFSQHVNPLSSDVFDQVNLIKTASHKFFISCSSQSVALNYNATLGSFSFQNGLNPPNNTICMNCEYDVSVTITNERTGKVVFTKNMALIPSSNLCPNNTQQVNIINESITLDGPDYYLVNRVIKPRTDASGNSTVSNAINTFTNQLNTNQSQYYNQFLDQFYSQTKYFLLRNEYVTKMNDPSNGTTPASVFSNFFAGSGAGNGGFSNALPLIGGTKFKFPSGLSVDKSGNIFVADFLNGAIRKYNVSAGFFTTLSKNSAWDVTWFNSFPARGGAYLNYLLYSDKQGNSIKKMNIDGTGVEVMASANINAPEGMSENSEGVVYFTSSGNGKVFRYTDPTDTNPIVEEVATSVSFTNPSDVEIDKNSPNIIYVSDRTKDQIYKIDVSTNAGTLLETYGVLNAHESVDNANGANAKFYGPSSLLYLNNFGDYTTPVLMVSDQGGHKIRLINLSGTHAVTTVSGLSTSGDAEGDPTAAKYNLPLGLCEDKGTIYIADAGNNRVKKLKTRPGTGIPCPTQPCYVNQWYPDETKIVAMGAQNKIVNLDGDPDGIGTAQHIGDEYYQVSNLGTPSVITSTSPIYADFVTAWTQHHQTSPSILSMEVYTGFSTSTAVKDLTEQHQLLNSYHPYYLLKVKLNTADCEKQCEDYPTTTPSCTSQCEEQLKSYQLAAKINYTNLAQASSTYAYSSTDNTQYSLQELVNPTYPTITGSYQTLNAWQKANLSLADLDLYQPFETAWFAVQQFSMSKCMDLCNGVAVPPCSTCVPKYTPCVMDNLNEITTGIEYIKNSWNPNTLNIFPFTLSTLFQTTASGAKVPDPTIQGKMGKSLFDYVVQSLNTNNSAIQSYCFWDNSCSGTGPLGGNCPTCYSPTITNGPNTFACTATSAPVDLSNVPSFIIPILETANQNCIKEFNTCMALSTGGTTAQHYLCADAKDNCIIGLGPQPAPGPLLVEWQAAVQACQNDYNNCMSNPASLTNSLQSNIVTTAIQTNLYPNATPADVSAINALANQLLTTAPPIGVSGLDLQATSIFMEKWISKKLCIKECQDAMHQQYLQWLQQLTNQVKADIKTAWASQCLGALNETFNISYDAKLYHYTLYNYDYGNNLVSTIPPEGIDYIDLTVTPNRQPVHRMLTQYKSNSLYTLEASSPDEGKTVYYYDKAGRIRFSQNAEQLARSNNFTKVYSYVKYDNESRVIETGEYRGPITPIQNMPSATHPTNPAATFDETYFTYDKSTLAFASPAAGYIQTYLAGRIAKTTNADGVSSHYSYDAHGRVTFVVQEAAHYGNGFRRFKTVDYNYLNLSSRVERITYQRWLPKERFIQEYTYDSDYRLTKTRISREGMVWLDAAEYEYYKHGPLKRTGLGSKAQDMDYVYNINGWLKAINNPVNINGSLNAGNEGLSSTQYAPDVFGEAINYFTGDYQRTGVDLDAASKTVPKPGSQWHNNRKDLYNGKITSSISYTAFDQVAASRPGVTQNSTTSIQPVLAQSYKYDVLGRLTDVYGEELAKTFTVTRTTGITPGVDDIYATNISYDANGNIKTLKRNSYYRYLNSIGAASTEMDNMTYEYDKSLSNQSYYTGKKKHNQLQYVYDAAANTLNGEDIQKDVAGISNASSSAYTFTNSNTHKYVYDAKGRIIHDYENKISISYNAYDKIKSISIDGTSKIINYIYNAQQQRIAKIKTGFGIKDGKEFYVYDANGILMANYTYTPASGIVAESHTLEDWHMYGAGRLGTYRVNQNLNAGAPITAISADKQFFEITDHLGSVRAVVKGQKKSDGNADIVNLTDYHEFGMSMQGRQYTADFYRFGYQGSEKEREGELKGIYTTEFRGLDVRLGRWFIPDPITHPWQSPYCSMDNDPIGLTDVMGLSTDGGDGGGTPTHPGNQNVIRIDESNNCPSPPSGPQVITIPPGAESCVSQNTFSFFSFEPSSTIHISYAPKPTPLDNTSQILTLPNQSPNGKMAGSMPPWINTGNEAHTTLTQYISLLSLSDPAWSANVTINGKKLPMRPDVIYDNGVVGGVWELKPAMFGQKPSPSVPFASIEALWYATILNEHYGTSRFGTGQSTGAPAPFVGVLMLVSPTGKLFWYVIPNSNSGAIYYYEYEPSFTPIPLPNAKDIEDINKRPLAPVIPETVPGGKVLDPKKAKETVKKTGWFITAVEVIVAILLLINPFKS